MTYTEKPFDMREALAAKMALPSAAGRAAALGLAAKGFAGLSAGLHPADLQLAEIERIRHPDDRVHAVLLGLAQRASRMTLATLSGAYLDALAEWNRLEAERAEQERQARERQLARNARLGFDELVMIERIHRRMFVNGRTVCGFPVLVPGVHHTTLGFSR